MHNLPNSIAANAASNIPINFHMFLIANCGEISTIFILYEPNCHFLECYDER